MNTKHIEDLATELEQEAEQRENTCIRNYGSADGSRQQLAALRSAATNLRRLAGDCFLGAINLKVTRS